MRKLKTFLFVIVILTATSCASYKYCPSYGDNTPQETNENQDRDIRA